MNDNVFFNFIGSKWFVLGLGIVMCLLLPTTYNNLIVVKDAGQLSSAWWVLAVFVINVITVIMAFFKFMSLLTTKKEDGKNW